MPDVAFFEMPVEVRLEFCATHTAWGDVAAELAAIREQTVEQAHALRAGVRICERRSRLLGLDAPVVTKSELAGSLGVYAEKLAAERELFAKLDVAQLEELAAASQALVDRAMRWCGRMPPRC